MKKGELFEIPFIELVTPKDGFTVMKDRFWMASNGNPLGCKKGNKNYPQCNSDARVTRMLANKLGIEDILFIPFAYWKDEGDLHE